MFLKTFSGGFHWFIQVAKSLLQDWKSDTNYFKNQVYLAPHTKGTLNFCLSMWNSSSAAVNTETETILFQGNITRSSSQDYWHLLYTQLWKTSLAPLHPTAVIVVMLKRFREYFIWNNSITLSICLVSPIVNKLSHPLTRQSCLHPTPPGSAPRQSVRS